MRRFDQALSYISRAMACRSFSWPKRRVASGEGSANKADGSVPGGEYTNGAPGYCQLPVQTSLRRSALSTLPHYHVRGDQKGFRTFPSL